MASETVGEASNAPDQKNVHEGSRSLAAKSGGEQPAPFSPPSACDSPAEQRETEEELKKTSVQRDANKVVHKQSLFELEVHT